nr:hypothetical protein [uncultured Campylobacter sp.]
MFFFAFLGFCFAMTPEQFKDYIAKNSKNIAQPQGTPSKIHASSPPLLYMLYALIPLKSAARISSGTTTSGPTSKKRCKSSPSWAAFSVRVKFQTSRCYYA